MSEGQPTWVEREIRVLDLAAIPLDRWRMVGMVIAAILVAAVLYLLFRDAPYVGRTVLVPAPTESRSGLSLVGLSAQLPFNLGSIGPSALDQRLLEGMLRSRTVADSVVAHLKLAEAWGLEDPRAASSLLMERTKVEGRPDRAILIEVRDDDPVRAALIANAYPEAVNNVSARVSAETAARRQAFLETQLEYVQDKLTEAEVQLVEFQRSQAAPVPDEQARQMIEVAAELSSQIMLKEVEVANLRRALTPQNPRLRQAMTELGALRTQLSGLTGSSAVGARGGDILLTLREAPGLGAEYVRLRRELVKNEQIHAALATAIAEARIGASSDLPVVSVLDPATRPGSTESRSPLFILAMAGLMGLLLGITGAFGAEWLDRARRDPRDQRFFRAWHGFAADIRQRTPSRGRASGPEDDRPV